MPNKSTKSVNIEVPIYFVLHNYWTHDAQMNAFWLETVPKLGDLIKVHLNSEEIDRRFEKTREQISRAVQDAHNHNWSQKEGELEKQHETQLAFAQQMFKERFEENHPDHFIKRYKDELEHARKSSKEDISQLKSERKYE